MDKVNIQATILVSVVLLVSACAETSIPKTLTSSTSSDQGLSETAPPTQQPALAALTAEAASPAPTMTISAEAENEANPTQDDSNLMEVNQMQITIGNHVLIADLADNSSANALKAALEEAPITIQMRDYGGMEKVGSLGRELPRNDEQITTEAGDIILYQGNALVIYYAPNSWNFTRLGKILDLSAAELKDILGDGDVSVTLSVVQE